MNQEIILSSLKIDEIRGIIDSSVEHAFQTQSKQFADKNENDVELLLSRKELLKLLQISPVTLWARMKDGSIPFIRVGRRVLFSKKAVLEGLRQKQNEECYGK